jgi:hypothetical protein
VLEVQKTRLKPLKLKIGKELMLCPNVNDKVQNCYKKELPGTIVYINRKHRFFTVEFKFQYGSFRESFKYIEKGDLACLTI